MGELAQFKEVHRIVPPNFNKANYEDAERGRRRRGVLALRPEEQGWQQLFCEHAMDPERTMVTVFDGGGTGQCCVRLHIRQSRRKNGLKCTKG